MTLVDLLDALLGGPDGDACRAVEHLSHALAHQRLARQLRGHHVPSRLQHVLGRRQVPVGTHALSLRGNATGYTNGAAWRMEASAFCSFKHKISILALTGRTSRWWKKIRNQGKATR